MKDPVVEATEKFRAVLTPDFGHTLNEAQIDYFIVALMIIIRSACEKTMSAAIQDRDMEWWVACCGVPGVAPDPLAVKKWIAAEAELMDESREASVPMIEVEGMGKLPDITNAIAPTWRESEHTVSATAVPGGQAAQEWTVIQDTPTMAYLMCGNEELAYMPRGAVAKVAAAHNATLSPLPEQTQKGGDASCAVGTAIKSRSQTASNAAPTVQPDRRGNDLCHIETNKTNANSKSDGRMPIEKKSADMKERLRLGEERQMEIGSDKREQRKDVWIAENDVQPASISTISEKSFISSGKSPTEAECDSNEKSQSASSCAPTVTEKDTSMSIPALGASESAGVAENWSREGVNESVANSQVERWQRRKKAARDAQGKEAFVDPLKGKYQLADDLPGSY